MVDLEKEDTPRRLLEKVKNKMDGNYFKNIFLFSSFLLYLGLICFLKKI